MLTSSEQFRKSAGLRVLALSALLALVLAPAGRVGSLPDLPDLPAQETVVRAPADAVGSGIRRIGLGRIGCLGCAGLFIGLGWGSVVGTFLSLAAWPEYVVLCGMGCLKAFG